MSRHPFVLAFTVATEYLRLKENKLKSLNRLYTV